MCACVCWTPIRAITLHHNRIEIWVHVCTDALLHYFYQTLLIDEKKQRSDLLTHRQVGWKTSRFVVVKERLPFDALYSERNGNESHSLITAIHHRARPVGQGGLVEITVEIYLFILSAAWNVKTWETEWKRRPRKVAQSSVLVVDGSGGGGGGIVC